VATPFFCRTTHSAHKGGGHGVPPLQQIRIFSSVLSNSHEDGLVRALSLPVMPPSAIRNINDMHVTE